ncbi:MAG TPA: tRNA lysidine(34) synthetase TilS [Rhizomicrobium sp.]|nr:tRNA lysidine(34) synthetase TilS [Rhizomicrobium sp.]
MASVGAPWPAVVGVSGGSDSLALMFLLRDWAKVRGLPPPAVVCVDHGIRPESRGEARQVARWGKEAGLVVSVLRNTDAKPRADVEAACRDIRYTLVGDWAAKRKTGAVYVAHTRDDQAETFLLRLARGSGVDGLAAMRTVSPYPLRGYAELALIRPLLGFDRQELRRYLEANGQRWIEDPMNADFRFVRARIRAAWPQLEELGLTRARLAEAAGHLGRARSALDAVSHAILVRAFRPWRDGVAVDPHALSGAPRELALRVLAGMLMLVGRHSYRPRFDRLEALLEAVAGGTVGRGRTLHGCRIAPAARKSSLFGAGTLLILPEKPSQTGGIRGQAPTAS